MNKNPAQLRIRERMDYPQPPLKYGEVLSWYEKIDGMYRLHLDQLSTQEAHTRFDPRGTLREICWACRTLEFSEKEGLKQEGSAYWTSELYEERFAITEALCNVFIMAVNARPVDLQLSQECT